MSVAVSFGSRKALHTLAQRLWYNPPLEADEPEDSWLLRVACLYRVSPLELLSHLHGFDFNAHQEDDRCAAAGESAAEIGISSCATHCDMGSYCPLCFARDIRNGRMPYFRHRWSRVWSTHCELDKTPLFLWPYRDTGGRLMLPDWIAQVHVAKKGTVRTADENRKFLVQLRYTRKVRKWIADDAPAALGWLQQLDLEWMLATKTVSPTYAIAGTSKELMWRVIADTVTLLCEQYNERPRSQASYLAGFLGPTWLYSRSFSGGRSLLGRDIRCLRSFTDPAQRRSLIALAMRVHISFNADPNFNEDGLLMGTGDTSLTRALRLCSGDTKRWASQRAKSWPDCASLGIRDSMDCKPTAWPVIGAF